MLFVGIESYIQWVFHPVDGGKAFYRHVCDCRLPRMTSTKKEGGGGAVYGSLVRLRPKSVIIQPVRSL